MERPDGYPLQGRRAIVVDDDVALLRILGDVLEMAGAAVTRFDRFEDAKRYLASGEGADVLVTDVRLGAYNGLQLALIARQEYPNMVVVVMTGHDDTVLRKHAEAAGAHYLTKPISPEHIVAEVAAALAPPA